MKQGKGIAKTGKAKAQQRQRRVPGLKHIGLPDWIIVGAETGNRKNKVRPEKDWLGGIVNGCAEHNIPLFMKESLCGLMGNDFRQEFLWEAYHDHL